MPNCKWRGSFYLGRVKHSGKALLAALRLIGLSGAAVVALLAVAFPARYIGTFVLDI